MATGGSETPKSMGKDTPTTGDTDSPTKTENPGRGMKFIMSAMGSKFSSVKHLSTSDLEQWLDTGDGQLVVLVGATLKSDSHKISNGVGKEGRKCFI